LSAQLRALEEFLGDALFDRRGRRLVLTPFGEEIASYADEIFRLGHEVLEAARGGAASKRRALRVGVVGTLPKSVAYGLLAHAIATPGYGPLVTRQGDLDRLLEELAAGRIHFVLSDAPPSEAAGIKVFAHLLAESGIQLFGTGAPARRAKRDFPRSLDDAPMLLPSAGTPLRRQIERWFADRGLVLRPAGEFDDAGLMRAAGTSGLGIFPVRASLRSEVEELAEYVGTLKGIVERYYVISIERRVRHPAVSALLAAGRVELGRRRK
jgi:LysR family transcriptional activator of nhaA